MPRRALLGHAETFETILAKRHRSHAHKTRRFAERERGERIDRSVTGGAQNERRREHLEAIRIPPIEKARQHARAAFDEKARDAPRGEVDQYSADVRPAARILSNDHDL